MTEKAEEDRYFYRINRELIEKQNESQGLTLVKYKTCPNCGAIMTEEQKGELRFDRCANCSGIFIEWEEFESLLKPQQNKSFYDYLDEQLQPDENWIADL